MLLTFSGMAAPLMAARYLYQSYSHHLHQSPFLTNGIQFNLIHLPTASKRPGIILLSLLIHFPNTLFNVTNTALLAKPEPHKTMP
jgi:hypothetical protein